MFGIRIHFAVAAAVLSIMMLSGSGRGLADTTPVLYHVQVNTVGCADAAAAQALTDPREPRRADNAWIKSTFNNGRCVSVSPRSTWKVISLNGPVALMEYVGDVGAPGSYYFNVNELFDPADRHPGDISAASSSPVNADQSSPTALAPNSDYRAASAYPDAPSRWTPSDILLVLIALCIAGAIGFFVGRRQAG